MYMSEVGQRIAVDSKTGENVSYMSEVGALIAVDSKTGENVSYNAPQSSSSQWPAAMQSVANLWAGVQTQKIAAKYSQPGISAGAPSISVPGRSNNNLLIYGGIALAVVALIMIASKK